MKTENLRRESCPQRDSTEYEEYAEVSSIYLPEDMEQERKLQADNLMEKRAVRKGIVRNTKSMRKCRASTCQRTWNRSANFRPII